MVHIMIIIINKGLSSLTYTESVNLVDFRPLGVMRWYVLDNSAKIKAC